MAKILRGIVMKYDIEKQHAKKKYHAIERIGLLLDPGTFCEIGGEICGEGDVPYDGVITGSGAVNGKIVYVFCQDFTIHGGTIGLVHGRKIAHLIETAILCKCPIIGIYDSGGARINEGINSLAGCGEMMRFNTLASGYIPQIAVVLGPCAGAAAYSPAINDFIFCVNTISNMYITGPAVIESVTGEKCTAEELGGAKVHAGVSGVAHVVCSSEKECFRKVRKLIDYLPSCFDSEKRNRIDMEAEDPINIDLDKILPEQEKQSYDVEAVIRGCIDLDSFFEIQEQYAPSLVVGFAKLYGCLVGIVANQPQSNGGSLDCDSSDKGARFVRFCDAFNIPVITFVDTPGYLPGMEQEHLGIIRHGAKLLFAYAEATTIKITVVLRKAHGGAYIAMGSKHLESDYSFALSRAEIAVMGAEGAVRILNRREIQEVDPKEQERFFQEKVEEYKRDYLNVSIAAKKGYVDQIIEIGEIRKKIGQCLQALENKKPVVRIEKKHSNIPL